MPVYAFCEGGMAMVHDENGLFYHCKISGQLLPVHIVNGKFIPEALPTAWWDELFSV